jgi:putative sterol carrier protein
MKSKSTKDVTISPTADKLIASLEKMVERIELPKNKKRFANYNKTLQLEFTDNRDLLCHILFNEGTATIVDGVDENAELMITTTMETLMAILNGELSPTRAFVAGKVKAKGPPNDLMKLQALMKN